MPLVGGRDSLTVPAGEMASSWLIREGKADLFIGYAHYATAMGEQEDVRSVAIPEPWNIRCDYYMAMLEESPAAQQFYQFILAEEGLRCLRDAGFMLASDED